MIRRHWQRFVWLGAVMAALSLITVVSLQRMDERHGDGEGPLASANLRGIGNSTAIDPRVGAADGVTAWSFGMRLCLTGSNTAAIVESVRPSVTVGAGFKFLGALVRSFTLAPTNDGIGSAAGFPPPAASVPDPIRDVAGFTVDTQCGSDAIGSVYTELILGFAVTGPDGGGWKGVDVSYASGGRRYVLAVDREFLICGTSVPDTCPRT